MTFGKKRVLPRYETSESDNIGDYIYDLVGSLEEEFFDISSAINGNVSTDLDEGNNQYIPYVFGSTLEGVGTYGHQVSYVFRRGIYVDVWFDIRWTAHTGTGNLTLALPYQCIEYDNCPFIGEIMAENLVFTGYLTGVVLPGTRGMEIVDSRSGATFQNIAVSNFDTTLRGHVRYAGTEIESV